MNKCVYSILLTYSLLGIIVLQGYAQENSPNIVIILADDLGYGSTGTYGASPSVLPTPAIDQLAKEGRMFTNAYTPSSVCSPTRYGLLTGYYQWREGPKYGVSGARSPLSLDTERPNYCISTTSNRL